MPTSPASPSADTPDAALSAVDPTAEVAERIRYLDEVMAEIDAEVRRRRASGDLPAGLERELDELFLEFSPVGLQGRARLRETLSLVEGSAYIDIAVPTESNNAVGAYIKRVIRKALGWYMGFIVAQVVKFAWSVSRMLHVVVDHIEILEATVDANRSVDLPTALLPSAVPGSAWWAPAAVDALRSAPGRVVVGDCGDGSLVEALIAEGIDAYGVDPSDIALEPALMRGVDVRGEGVLHHLDVVATEALAGVALTGSVQWLRPIERERLIELLSTRLVVDGIVVLHSTSPESWAASTSPVVRDLAPGRPLHAETWAHLLVASGFSVSTVLAGGGDRSLAHVTAGSADADTLNAAIDTINARLLGVSEYLVVAVRVR